MDEVIPSPPRNEAYVIRRSVRLLASLVSTIAKNDMNDGKMAAEISNIAADLVKIMDDLEEDAAKRERANE